MKRIVSYALILCLCSVLLSSCAAVKKYDKYTMSFFGTFDTVVTIQGFAQNKEIFDKVTSQAEARFREYHRMFDNYHSYEGINNVYTLNHAAGDGPFAVPKPLFDVIKYSKDSYDLAQGNFNIALGSVINLWHDARDEAELDALRAYLPDRTSLLKANEHTDINDIVLDEENLTVTILDPNLRIDLGAIAKGYATELVVQEMFKSEMTSFYVNAGGNIRLGDAPMDGRKNWGVSIQDPDGAVLSDANTDLMEVLFLHNVSVVTSGDYQRYFVYQGKRYHHLLSPDTLMPTDFMRSVTIITEDSGYADLLSTAVFLMPFEEGIMLVDKLQGVEAVWVLNDRSVVMTEGIKNSARSQGATNPSE